MGVAVLRGGYKRIRRGHLSHIRPLDRKEFRAIDYVVEILGF